MEQALTIEGFKRVVLLEDIFILLFGIYIGGLVMTYLISKIFTNTKAIESKHFDKVGFVKFTSKDGKKTYFINSKRESIFEVMRVILIIIFSPSFLSKTYVIKNEKVAKFLVRVLWIVGIIISILAIKAIARIELPPPTPL